MMMTSKERMMRTLRREKPDRLPVTTGGYTCSASDHFFHAPVENLLAFARAGRECVY